MRRIGNEASGETRAKLGAARLSLGTNILLTLVKTAAAAVTGSVSLMSEAAHSATDIVASGLAYYSVSRASEPADHDHPYGHGKFESLASFGESVLLLTIVAYVAFEAVQRLIWPSPLQSIGVGLWLMVLSSVIVLIVAIRVSHVAQRTGSLALRSNAQHLFVDFYTNLGVLSALAVQQYARAEWADPVLALGLAVWIGRNAWRMGKIAFDQLVDRSLPDDEVESIRQIALSTEGVLGCHRLRTRLSGTDRTIDFHIVVPAEWSVVQAHDLADALEHRLETEFQPATVVIHVDPFDLSKQSQRARE